MPSRGGDGGDGEEEGEEMESVLMSSRTSREGRPRGDPLRWQEQQQTRRSVDGGRKRRPWIVVSRRTDPKMVRSLVTAR